MLEYQFSHIFHLYFYHKDHFRNLCKIFKLNERYIGYFYIDSFYYIELGDEQKIFRKDIPLDQDANKYFNITNSRELIEQKLADIIPS